jgi:hypothetical protein
VFWGVPAGVCAVVYTVVVAEEPVREAWLYIVLAEILLGLGLHAVLVDGGGFAAAVQ